MTDSPQWNFSTERGAAQAICHGSGDIDDAWEDYIPEARDALAYLADEGLLLPPGGEVYIEWGFVHRNDRGGSFSSANEAVAQDMFQRAGGNDKARWGIRVATEWPETGGQYHGPWQFSGE
jgi:hypothetical protein